MAFGQQVQQENTIINTDVANNRSNNTKECEKIEKYHNIKLEIQKLWEVKAEVVLVISGILRNLMPELENYVKIDYQSTTLWHTKTKSSAP